MGRTKDARTVGRMLRRMRQEAELSQAEVAEKFGRKQAWISKLESGFQPLLFEELVEFCDLYGVSVLEAVRKIERALRGEKS